ncbi:MAG: hypothetical protein WCA85_25885 [Paraburkholderia sp.]|uniref:hypothetical protein n=1 Tax=Paraburkholderia sp. TaxID=1926495 RepID=UPI003C5FF62B
MAGEWIKMRTNLWDDPRVSRLCDLTGCTEAAVVGGLYWLWATADDHSADGVLVGMTPATIARKTGVPNLGAALAQIGWIEEIDGGIRIFKFDDHNGVSAKSRAQTAKRVASHRGNGDVTPPALQEPNAAVTGALAREDKSKTKEEPPIPPKGGDGPEDTGAGKPTRKAAVSLKTFLEECRKAGEKPILKDDPVFAYADQTGIPDEFLKLHWLEFKERYCLPDAKRYKDWRSVYRKSVRGCWFKLWYLRADGACGLTTQGEQAKRHHGKDE